MANISPNNATGTLAEFLKALFDDFKKNRSALEEKWNKNREAFRCISSGKAWKSEEAEGWRSNTFIGIIKQKVIVAYSLIVDTLLAGGKIPFMLKPDEDSINQPDEVLQAINADIEKMSKRIECQLEKTHADRSFMQNLLSAAIYGETYAKREVMEITKEQFKKITTDGEGTELEPGAAIFELSSESMNVPGWGYRSVWNIFRDIEEDDPRKGIGWFDYDMVSAHWLRKKMGKAFYIDENIKSVISEIDNKTKMDKTSQPTDAESLPPKLREIAHRQKTIEYREFMGRVPRETAVSMEKDLVSMGLDLADFMMPGVDISQENEDPDGPDAGDDIEIMCCLAGDKVVRYARTRERDRALHRAVWEMALDEVVAVGVPDNLEHIQRVLNGAVRAFEDNKKLSANVMSAMVEQYILDPEEAKKWKPGLNVPLNGNCDDARKAISQIIIQDVGQSLLSLIEKIEQYSEEESMLPKISQGISENPDQTAYSIAQQIEKAGKYIGGVIKNIDEGLIEPMLQWYYEYNMLDPAVTEGKGNYSVQALGFSSFQDRYIKLGKIMQFMSMVLNSPELASWVKIQWLIKELAKGLDLDPDQAMKTLAEKQTEDAARAELEKQTVASKTAPVNPQAEEAKTEEVKAKARKADAEAVAKTIEADIKLSKAELETVTGGSKPAPVKQEAVGKAA